MSSSSENEHRERIPVILITGLPGSGRSTLVSSLMRSLPTGARCAVCLHLHARAFSLETAVLPLSSTQCLYFAEIFDFGSGCLCCSPDGDLARLLAQLTVRQNDLGITHVLIETTGVADPRSFINLFTSESSLFELHGVVCVVDLHRAKTSLGSSNKEFASRGLAQLHAADVLVLNRFEDLVGHSQNVDEEIADVRSFLLSTAVSPSHGTTPALANPIVIGPCSWCDLTHTHICETLNRLSVKRHHSIRGLPKLAVPLPSTFVMNFGTATSHDAALETACVIIPRGGVHLDAALGLLQAFMLWWGGIRVQGYLSFLPREAEGVASREFPPELCRSWAMPMVVVDGIRGQLNLRAVERVAVPGEAAACADETGQPWQETAMETAAADRGGCKLFVCGHNLNAEELQSQLAQTASQGFKGPLGDLKCMEQFSDLAEEAWRNMDESIAAATKASSFRELKSEDNSTNVTSLSEKERDAAEAFSRRFAASLRATLPAEVLHPPRFEPLESILNICLDRDEFRQRLRLRWEHGRIFVQPVHVMMPLGTSSDSTWRVAKWTAEIDNGQACPKDLDVLIVGTNIFYRLASK